MIESLLAIGIDEICPRTELVTAGKVDKWHSNGFNVCAWGVRNADSMEALYETGGRSTLPTFRDDI